MAVAFSHRLRVRYSECDAQGVAFNANYLTWMDLAMTELWRETVPGGYTAMRDGGTDMVVAAADLRYLAPARFDELIDVGVGVSRLGETSMTTDFELLRAGVTLTEASLRHVFVSVTTGDKTSIPAPVRAALEPYLIVAA